MIDIDFKLIRRLLTWAGLASPEEQQERQETVKRVLTHEVDEAELAYLAKVLDDEGIGEEPKSDEDEADEDDEQVQIYGKKSRGYMRATKEEGIAAEIAKMNEEARGTPFFKSNFDTSRTTPSRELLERLKRHTTKGDGRK